LIVADGLLDVAAGTAAFFGPVGLAAAGLYYGADYLAGGNLAAKAHSFLFTRRKRVNK